MKIEVGESLGYSYLRHVKKCWLVQANWKVSACWSEHRQMSNTELENLFHEMQDDFDPDRKVFKKTKDVHQLVRQAEIDIVGVDLSGDVYALEVAFHEYGLRYGDAPDSRILKKLLRTYLILRAYHGLDREIHISFLSPKVNPAVKKLLLKEVFNRLEKKKYPKVTWSLLVNEDFRTEVLQATLKATKTVADSSELFVRAMRLLEVAEKAVQSDSRQPQGPNSGLNAILDQWPGDETDDEIAAELENLS